MLHAIAFVTIAALNTAVGSISVSATVPVICQDYQVGDKVVVRCNDKQPLAPPVGGVPFGQPHPPGVKPVANATQAPALVAPGPAGNNATLCIRCSFY